MLKCLQLIVSILLCPLASTLMHDLLIRNDERNIFKIETFGFVEGGQMNFDLSDFSMYPHITAETPAKIGFVMRKAATESASQQDLEQVIDKGTCLLDVAGEDDFVINISDQTDWERFVVSNTIKSPNAAGLYSLIFVRCAPVNGNQKVNFHLKATFFNPGPDYLSAGDAPLPAMYFAFFIVFSAALFAWCVVVFRCFGNNGTVHHIHYMMMALLVLKCFTLLFESIRLFYISKYGASESWSIVYFIFAGLKGVMLFTVILLIGSGWSLMKPFLNDQEKRVIVVVLTLQVLDNIAMVVLEETAPGSQGWLTWRDILHLIDIICCCAILFPIVWSIRHLRQASESDGKAYLNLQKLQLFRQFYVMVVVYIYFTRIVVLLLSATIPFYLVWLGDLFTELATFAFYVVTGYQFRPAVSNPYLMVQSEDMEHSEYGLEKEGGHGFDDDDVTPVPAGPSSNVFERL